MAIPGSLLAALTGIDIDPVMEFNGPAHSAKETSMDSTEKDKPVSTPPPDPAKQVRFYKGLSLSLALAFVFSGAALWRTLATAEKLVSSFEAHNAQFAKLEKVTNTCIAQATEAINQLKTCQRTLESSSDSLAECSSALELSAHDLESASQTASSLVGCQEQLLRDRKQSTLTSIRLREELESCNEDNESLQKDLLRPCPSM